MTSRSLTYTLEFTDKTSTTVKNVTAAVQGLGTASTQALGQMAQSTTTANTAMERLKVSVTETERSASTLHSSSTNMFEGFLQAQIVTEALSAVKDGVTSLIGDSVKLAGQFEQSQIGFTAMLGGNKQAADTMLAQLQQLANVTPFTFEGEQQAARQLLAMGQTAANVLPELHDIDTAVAAIGGTDVQVGQVTAALAKMGAEGKTSAIFMNELTRDGVPAWTMLAEEMGKSVSEVRALATQGSIASSVFDQAFHDYTVRHWGDALQAQSQTFNGLLSTASDFGQQLERTFGQGIIAELEPRLKGALDALQNPAVIAWVQNLGVEAGKVAGWFFDAATWVAQMIGGPLPQLTTLTQGAAASANDFAGNWTSATAPVETVKNQVKDIQGAVAGMRDDVAAVDAGYAAQTATIRDQQAVFNAGMTERIAAVNAEKTASDQASQSRLAGLHAQVNSLQEAYRLEDERINLTRAQTKLGEDTALAGDIFSSAGASARSRILGDRQAVADSERKISRQSALDGLQDRITAEEASKQAADQGFATRLTALETERRRTDANFASELRGIEDRKRAYDAASAERIRMDEAAIRAIEAAQTASNTAIVNTRKQGDDISTRYENASTMTAIGAMTAEYSQFYGTTLPTTANTARPTIFTALFGTPGEQQEVGYNLAKNAINGIGTAFHDWTGGHGSPIMGMIMGGSSPADALKNWANNTAGLENLGGDLAKALFPENKGLFNDPNNLFGHIDDTPKTRTGMGPNDLRPTNPPPGRSWGEGTYIQVGGAWIWRETNPNSGPTSSGSFGGTVPYTAPAGDSRPPQVVIHVGSIIGTDTGDLARTISEQIANQTRGRH